MLLIRKAGAIVAAALLLGACTNYEYHETRQVPISKLSDSQEQRLVEEEILDVGIVLFDPGQVDLDTDETDFSSVRQSEAVWFTQQLKETLERSNAWGMVRALPNNNLPMDVSVFGEIIHSNGEQLDLKIQVSDNTGRVWYEKNYEQQASQYAYNPEVNLPGDPFQATFNEIANDLFDFQNSLTAQNKRQIRSLGKVLFARDFVPDAFNAYVATDKNGQLALQRIPAADDPMMQRVDRIRARNDLFVDVVQDFYRAFNSKMSIPYTEWRKLAYKETVYARQLREQARKEKIAGMVAIAGGIAAATSGNSRTTRVAGHGAIFSGAGLFRQSFTKRERSLSHSATLRELGDSLAAELEPSIVELQDRSVTLTGTVEDQYAEWRRILGEMFRLESGSANTLADTGTDSTLTGDQVNAFDPDQDLDTEE